MGPKTAEACQKFGAVYMHAVGGAAVALAEAIKEVVTVHLYDELGPPEAFWVLRVEDFRGVVTIDSHGGSLHKDVLGREQGGGGEVLRVVDSEAVEAPADAEPLLPVEPHRPRDGHGEHEGRGQRDRTSDVAGEGLHLVAISGARVLAGADAVGGHAKWDTPPGLALVEKRPTLS